MNADLLFPIFLLLLASAYLFTTFEYVKIKRRYRKSQTELNDLTVTWCKAATNFRKWKDQLLHTLMMVEIQRDEAIVKATHRRFELDRLNKEYEDVAMSYKTLKKNHDNLKEISINYKDALEQADIKYNSLEHDFKRVQPLNLAYQQALEISYVEIEELKLQLEKRNGIHNEMLEDLKTFTQELETPKAVKHE